jgi:hypothetical protein
MLEVNRIDTPRTEGAYAVIGVVVQRGKDRPACLYAVSDIRAEEAQRIDAMVNAGKLSGEINIVFGKDLLDQAV